MGKPRLTDTDVLLIRRDVKQNKTPTTELARRYRVTTQTIRNALNGPVWEHLDGIEAPIEPSGAWAGLDKEARRQKIQAMIDDGKTQGDVSRELNLSRPLVSLILKGDR